MVITKNCDIICFSLLRWDSPISSPALSLAKEFAKNHRVFFIDHPFSWKDYLLKRNSAAVRSRKNALLKGKNIYTTSRLLPDNLTIVTPRLTIPVNFLPKGILYNRLSAINNSIILKAIRQLIKDHSIKDFIYINFFDPYFVRTFPTDIKPQRTIYHCMDDISQVKYSNRHGTKLEKEIITNFDYTLCSSKELTSIKSHLSRNVFYFPNGADIQLFQKASGEALPTPPEFTDLNKEIIGFTGSIEYRTDFDLLKKLAVYHQDKMLMLVGPVNTNEHITSGLTKLSNVVFTGARDINRLPAYLQNFNCVIIPYRKNRLTKSIYPLKINEYLAAGKAVISTNFSDDISEFEKVIYLAENHDQFIQAIDMAIKENNNERQEARRKIASANSWSVRVDEFWKLIG